MRLRATLAQVGCNDDSEMNHPPPNGLVRDHNPPLGEQVFNVAEAEREPEVQPNRLVNDLRREPVARVADFLHPLGYRASKPPASGRCRDNSVRTPCYERVWFGLRDTISSRRPRCLAITVASVLIDMMPRRSGGPRPRPP